jgi:hypothetical protein
VFLSSDDESNRIRVDSVTTLVLYALRSYYEDKSKDAPLFRRADPELGEKESDAVKKARIYEPFFLQVSSDANPVVPVPSGVMTVPEDEAG